jgi:hypothetical protein
LSTFIADIGSAVNRTINSMNVYAVVNSTLPAVKFNKGLRDTQSAGAKAISSIFQIFEDVVGGLTGVSRAHLESVFFDDQPNNKFPLSCVKDLFSAKNELQTAYTTLGGRYNSLEKPIEGV